MTGPLLTEVAWPRSLGRIAFVVPENSATSVSLPDCPADAGSAANKDAKTVFQSGAKASGVVLGAGAGCASGGDFLFLVLCGGVVLTVAGVIFAGTAIVSAGTAAVASVHYSREAPDSATVAAAAATLTKAFKEIKQSAGERIPTAIVASALPNQRLELRKTGATPAELAALRRQGFATVAEVSGIEIRLERFGGSDFDPDLRLSIELSLAVEDIAGRFRAGPEKWKYVGVPYKFTEWGANDGARLRTELDAAYRAIAVSVIMYLAVERVRPAVQL